MASTASSRKRTDKVSSDNARLTFDLLSNLTYMQAVAASHATRDRIFELAITQTYATTFYFSQVYLLVKRLGFEYHRAFQLVAKKTKATRVQSLLLRFASSISTGESEEGFLRTEARVQREIYDSEYYRKLESLQKWSDAYAALLVSVTVIVVVAMVSSMLYDAGEMFVAALCITSLVIAGIGAFIIRTASPVEMKTYKGRRGPKLRRWAIRLVFALPPVGLLCGYYFYDIYGTGAVFLALGLALLPAGICAYVDDQRVSAVDQNISDFLRALGSVTGTLGSTLTVGLSKLDVRSMGPLEPYIVRLRARLQSHLNPDACWEQFRDEAGSELVNRSSRMLVDGVALGGNPGQVGTVASDYSMGIALLRAKRDVASLTFAYLTFPMHTAMVGLLVFILEVIQSFNLRLTNISETLVGQMGSGQAARIPDLPVFHAKDLSLVSNLLLLVIVGFTVSNSMAPKFATGGHPVKAAFYASVICSLSGVCLIFIPPVARQVLV